MGSSIRWNNKTIPLIKSLSPQRKLSLLPATARYASFMLADRSYFAALLALLPHAAFAPYRELTHHLIQDHSDALIALNALRPANAVFRFVVSPSHTLSALAFERHAIEHGEICMRPDSLHDLLNALVWLTFPQSKLAISQAHVMLGHTDAQGNGRSRRRDILTLFDESGLILICPRDELLELHALHTAHDWQGLFVQQRQRFIHQVRPLYFGHGGLEQLALKPHRGLTAKTLWLAADEQISPEAIDSLLAQYIRAGQQLHGEQRLLPLPILGIPGWFTENNNPNCYLDTQIFRPKRNI